VEPELHERVERKSLPGARLVDRALCALFFLLLAAIALTLIPRKTSLARLDLATLDGKPIAQSTLLTDLAHAPAAGQPAVNQLVQPGDRFVLSGYPDETIQPQSLTVTPGATVGQLLRWISNQNGWPARIGVMEQRRFFFAPPPRGDLLPQIQFGSPNVYKLQLVHRWNVLLIWLPAAAAALTAAAAWLIDLRRMGPHG